MYPNGKYFLNTASHLIEKDEELNNLIFAIAESNLTIESERTDTYPIFITVNPDDYKDVIIAAILTPSNRMVIYSQATDDSPFQFIVENIIENNILIPGVLGPNENALKFSKAWEQMTGRVFNIFRKEHVYKISEVKKISHPQGFFRNAVEKDFSILKNWVMMFNKETFSEPVRNEKVSEFVKEKIISQSLFVWEDKNIVSMAASTKPTSKGISINMVYTPAIYRRKGYARSCVSRLTKKLLNEGYAYCTLFTDLMNSTSNKIYKEIGYKGVRDLLAIDFK